MSNSTAFDPGLPHLRRDGDLTTLAACVLGSGLSVLLGWQMAQLPLALAGVGVLLGAAALVFAVLRGTWLSSVALPVLLMSIVALNIQLGGGRSEFHFGVFTSIAFLLAYRHWVPIAAGAADGLSTFRPAKSLGATRIKSQSSTRRRRAQWARRAGPTQWPSWRLSTWR